MNIYNSQKIEKSIEYLITERDKTQEKYNQLNTITGTDKKEGGDAFLQAINLLNENIERKQQELNQVNETLKAIE